MPLISVFSSADVTPFATSGVSAAAQSLGGIGSSLSSASVTLRIAVGLQ